MTATIDEIGLDALRERLGHRLPGLRESAEPIGSLELLDRRSIVSDDPSKVLVRGLGGRPLAMALCSCSAAPRLAERGARRAEASRHVLGEHLGSVILEPVLTGEIGGLTFVVLPWYESLATSHWGWAVQRTWLRPFALRWLREANHAAVRHHRGTEARQSFVTALEHLAGRSLSDPIRREVDYFLERLERGRWVPSHTLDHNDLWSSNFLRAHSRVHERRSEFPFVIIDWLGAQPKGYGMYDLVRLAESMQVGRLTLRHEIAGHCEALGCEPADAGGHLLACLGGLGIHLEHFPEERFAGLVQWSWSILRSAQPAPPAIR